MDDVAINRTVLRRLCEAAGAAVLEASDGAQAYQLYKAAGGPAAIQMVFMDLRMPGWQACAHIRELEAAAGWPAVPVIACTTEDLSTGSYALQRCWECGMNAATVSTEGPGTPQHTGALRPKRNG